MKWKGVDRKWRLLGKEKLELSEEKEMKQKGAGRSWERSLPCSGLAIADDDDDVETK